MIQHIRDAIKRHQPCPCGSGLKFKWCHGSETIKQACQKAAALMFMHCITPFRLQHKVIDQEEYTHIMSQVDTALVEMVVGGQGCNGDVVESEDRKQEQRDVGELQSVVKLVRCSKCGRPVPAGTKCIKCGEVVNE